MAPLDRLPGGRPRGGSLEKPDREGSTERHLAERIARLPDPVRPFVEDVREFVRREARSYAEANERPRRPRDFKVYVRRFLQSMSEPLDAIQREIITFGYRHPAPLRERGLRTAGVAVSAGTAGYGQTIAYGSAFTATVGALTVGIVGEIIELYALASARTSAYRWAGLSPGEKVVADDLEQILRSKHVLTTGTTRHLGDELVTALLERFEHAVVHEVTLPVLGPLEAGYRTHVGLKRAFGAPLTQPAAGEDYGRTPDAISTLPTLAELLARLTRPEQGKPRELGWSGD